MRRRESVTHHAPPQLQAVAGPVRMVLDDIYRHLFREGVGEPGADGAAGADGHQFTDRGDPVSVDFEQGDLTGDSTWRDLDLSGIVAEGAVAVLLRIYLDGGTNPSVKFRKNGNTNDKNVAEVVSFDSDDIIVACDTARKIEYYSALLPPTVRITVGGWWA